MSSPDTAATDPVSLSDTAAIYGPGVAEELASSSLAEITRMGSNGEQVVADYTSHLSNEMRILIQSLRGKDIRSGDDYPLPWCD